MSAVTQKKKVLFLCTGNSCRSQMAEGWANRLLGDKFDFFSAGVAPHGLDPLAVKAMLESGVDISHHRSKTVDEFKDANFDFVVTVCNSAAEQCPVFPGRCRIIHHDFDDPPKLAETEADEERRLNCYRRVRDKIREFIAGDLASMLQNTDRKA